jgi:hypothetical protein
MINFCYEYLYGWFDFLNGGMFWAGVLLFIGIWTGSVEITGPKWLVKRFYKERNRS